MEQLITECRYKNSIHTFDERIHDNYEIIFVTEGSAELTIDNTTIKIQKGDIIFLNNITYHKFLHIDTPFHRYITSISSKEFEKSFSDNNLILLFKRNPADEHWVIHVDNTFYFVTVFDKIIHELYSHSDEYSQNLIKAYLEEILILSFRCSRNPDVFDDDIKSKILSMQKTLKNNFQYNIKISDICKELYVSNYYLTHRFTEFTGISPKQYLMQIRLSNAESLLRTTNLSIVEVAERCGFQDPSNFIKSFKKFFGATPKAFKSK